MFVYGVKWVEILVIFENVSLVSKFQTFSFPGEGDLKYVPEFKIGIIENSLIFWWDVNQFGYLKGTLDPVPRDEDHCSVQGPSETTINSQMVLISEISSKYIFSLVTTVNSVSIWKQLGKRHHRIQEDTRSSRALSTKEVWTFIIAHENI